MCFLSEINNVHAIFGVDAQVDDKEVYVLEPDAEMYKLYRSNQKKATNEYDPLRSN